MKLELNGHIYFRIMVNLIWVIAFTVVSNALIAQSCFPFGTTLRSQADIDNFTSNNPGCVIIEGSLVINDLDDGIIDIENLNGLSGIQEIGRNLELLHCNKLKSLQGLNNLNLVGGDLRIHHCDLLNDLLGFDQLSSIEGSFEIVNNAVLDSISGTPELRSVRKTLLISDNPLLDLDRGLDSLKSVGFLSIGWSGIEQINIFSSIDTISGGLFITQNPRLKVISGFDSLKYIGEFLDIGGCDSLLQINGFNELQDLDGFLTFSDLPLLSTITGFDKLKKVESDFYIFDIGGWQDESLAFNSLDSVGGLFFMQSTRNIDHLPFDNLSYVGGDFYLFELGNLTDFSGFNKLEIIDGEVIISGSLSLYSFDGFNNLKAVGGDFTFSLHPILEEFKGFNSLQSTGGSLNFSYNDMVREINNFGQLEAINGSLILIANSQLSSISGLSGIDPTTIKVGEGEDYELIISQNPALSNCAIESICGYFEQSAINAFVGSNGIQCGSEAHIINACTTSSSSSINEGIIKMYPLPARDHLWIELGHSASVIQAKFYTPGGQLIHQEAFNSTDTKTVIKLGQFPSGLYILHLHMDEQIETQLVPVIR